MKKTLAFVLFGVSSGIALPAQAQFEYYGKNKVIYDKKLDKFYKSAHFDFYHAVDLNDPAQAKEFAGIVGNLENGYTDLSSKHNNHELKKRPSVIVYKSHFVMEASFIEPSFIPEDIGAYADPWRCRLVLKHDFIPPLQRTIQMHELEHIFQFEIMNLSIVQWALPGERLPRWIMEGGADFIANWVSPYTRDDIRRMVQRGVGANPELDLPKLVELNDGRRANPYIMGAMIFEFLKETYGDEAVLKFYNSCLTARGRIMDKLTDASGGVIRTSGTFDRMHRDFWRKKFASTMAAKPKPYEENENFRGRFALSQKFHYPVTSPVISPTGEEVAFLSWEPVKGVVVAKTQVRPKEDPIYDPKNIKRESRFKRIVGSFVSRSIESQEGPHLVKVLTNLKPPNHYEYIVAQDLVTWPFNGYDLDWWQDPIWVSQIKELKKRRDVVKKDFVELLGNKDADINKVDELEWGLEQLNNELEKLENASGVSKLVFFARKNRDHAVFIIDANRGDIMYENQVSVDQAFSPAFSPDGQTVYFSASKNMVRDIYALNISSGSLDNVTADEYFDTAPMPSPDGQRLVYVRFVGDFQKLFLLNLATGKSEQITFGRSNENSPTWYQDGSNRLYLTSDRAEKIWNLYTMNMDSGEVFQQSDFYGAVFTPRAIPGEPDRLYYVGYWQYDQFNENLHANLELFDISLKVPLRVTSAGDGREESMEYVLNSKNLTKHTLDPEQIKQPLKAPSKWNIHGNTMYVTPNVYRGSFSYTRVLATDILENRVHGGLVAYSGTKVRIFDYMYLDRSQRWAWGFSISDEKYPLRYRLFDFQEGYPKQFCQEKNCNDQKVLNIVGGHETKFEFVTQYPFTKWTRVEMKVSARKRDYNVFLTDEDVNDPNNPFSDIDRAFHQHFNQADNSTSLPFSATLVHDTAMYSYSTMGPIYGNVLRVEATLAPSVGRFDGYMSSYLDGRKYFNFGSSSVLALRGLGMVSSRPTGDFMNLGGSDTLRAFPYGSIAGDRVAYGSAELRFPLLRGIIFPGGIGLGPIRGLLFGDYGVTKFSKSDAPALKADSYGFGFQFTPFNFVWAKRSIDGHRTFDFDFYISYGF